MDPSLFPFGGALPLPNGAMKYRIVIPCQVMQEHPIKMGFWNRVIEFSVLDAESPDDAVDQARTALHASLENTNRASYPRFDDPSSLMALETESESLRGPK